MTNAQYSVVLLFDELIKLSLQKFTENSQTECVDVWITFEEVKPPETLSVNVSYIWREVV